ncbi:hypothetical protein N1851_028510 [Merluccius polli]|uniref:Reverse transcriptase domain-containing protein n=1 Tax=Merluccius polli TaxID=89951 RepID=A0AA47M8Y1_MERPO|nr:hypothetical protein N1851_028510 [Merluccius polli]
MVEYRMVVHLFGATSSPSCANFALRRCAEDNKEFFSQHVFETIMHSFYVDDLLASLPSEREAICLYEDLRKICAKGGFNLTKWMSNSCSVLAAIPEEERAKEVKDLDQDILPVERALGVRWCAQSDTFGFSITFPDRPLTRRGILSTVGSFYDPLGILSPVIFTAKRILQDLCRKAQEWRGWVKELQTLDGFRTCRCLKPPNFGEITSAQLHHFADTSEEGYGTEAWPVDPEDLGRLTSGDPEVKVSATVSVEQEKDNAVTCLINRSSSWTRLLRVMVWILRLKAFLLSIWRRKVVNAQSPQPASSERQHKDIKLCRGHLSLEEIKTSEMEIIKLCQMQVLRRVLLPPERRKCENILYIQLRQY